MQTKTLLAACAALLMTSGAASAKCTLTLKFNNNNPSGKIVVLGKESQVRVNGGTWSKLNFADVTVKSGKSGSASWKTNMSCGGSAKRDFRIRFEDKRDNVIYTNTRKNNIDIYDGQRLTWGLKR